MKILIVGFQRSGTTLLRRLIQLHPQVRTIFHEKFLLKMFKGRKSIIKYAMNNGVDVTKDSWGEKVPYYPSARKYPIGKYCEDWENYFGKDSRILHILRHPYDIAFSTVKKFKNTGSIAHPIKIYKRIMPISFEKINNLKSSYTFKYEDLLLNPDQMMFNIYKYCGLEPDIDFKKKMTKTPNPKYQKIDPSRALAYRKQDINRNYKLENIIELLNSIGTTKYKI